MSPSPRTFLSLPAEIRNLIYTSLFAGAVIEDHGFAPYPICTKNYHLAITMTNRQVRAESLPILQLVTLFHFRLGQAGTPPVPRHVLKTIKTVRSPAHRLKTLDVSTFSQLDTLLLDVSIDPYLWKMFEATWKDMKPKCPDGKSMVSLGMELGVFEREWNIDAMWRDQSRDFRMVCSFRMWVRDGSELKPILIDIDSDTILQESSYGWLTTRSR